jgi:hypothetical protein
MWAWMARGSVFRMLFRSILMYSSMFFVYCNLKLYRFCIGCLAMVFHAHLYLVVDVHSTREEV